MPSDIHSIEKSGHSSVIGMTGSPAAVQISSPKAPSMYGSVTSSSPKQIAVALLTGGTDRHYAFGLATSLASHEVNVDVIGSDLIDSPEMHSTPRLRFLNLHGCIPSGRIARKLWHIARFYIRLGRYAWSAQPKVFHILWNNKVELFDRTLLMLCYKLLGKRVVFTAHNVNSEQRDGRERFLNRLGLLCQYSLSDHIFVHTREMKAQLVEDFRVSSSKVTIIPYGINNAIPETPINCTEARRRLGLASSDKVILFFGAIKSYKGLEYLLAAFHRIVAEDKDYCLLIAGEPKKDHNRYFSAILDAISAEPHADRVRFRFEFIPDSDTELYFKAADVTVLPYVGIFQSGILFLAYSFGLPVIATDVGSFHEDIVNGQTGYICRPRDAADLAETLLRYFESELYRDLDKQRTNIRRYVHSRHSWDSVSKITRAAYSHLLGQ
jgi:D-inositol-3-phosphate glycosyltransferase